MNYYKKATDRILGITPEDAYEILVEIAKNLPWTFVRFHDAYKYRNSEPWHKAAFDAMINGRKVRVIKKGRICREVAGMDLISAKKAIEAEVTRLAQVKPGN